MTSCSIKVRERFAYENLKPTFGNLKRKRWKPTQGLEICANTLKNEIKYSLCQQSRFKLQYLDLGEIT